MRYTLLVCCLLAALSSSALAQRTYTKGVVAADHPAASEAGAEMLHKGGNAVDAAVAASFALSVVRPQSCGVGGGGFMLVHLADDPKNPGSGPVQIAINYRERAPKAVGEDYFVAIDDPDASRWTGHAVATPGTVFGLLHALERYGTLDRATVLAPAIKLAEDGFLTDGAYVKAAKDTVAWFEEAPERKQTHAMLWERFLNSGEPAVGLRIKNPEQARALRLIGERGADAFTTGPLAEAIVRSAQARGGALTLDDLRDYSVDERVPLRADFLSRRVLAMPPPSSGGVATLQVLGVLDRLHASRGVDLKALGHNSADYIHVVTEALKHAFADRAAFLGDSDESPVDRLLSDEYLDRLAAGIDLERTHRYQRYGMAAAPIEDDGTSHISVVDAHGNAVACSETINLGFGSRIVVEGFGFFLNNEMDDFTTRPGEANHFGLQQSDLNAPGPGKRPLSSMSPTIVLDADGRVELVLGASGGPRIITGVIQAALNALVFDMPAYESVDAPRFHHQWRPNVLAIEPAMDPEFAGHVGESIEGVQDMLRTIPIAHERRVRLNELGHRYGTIPEVGVVQLIRRVAGSDAYDAASDPRKGGLPAGFE